MKVVPVEVVRAAYEEAMLRHGLPPSTIALIHLYADENLSALDDIPQDGAIAHIRDGCDECRNTSDRSWA